ncbi:hypothetical protein ACFP1I_32025 [Dyadobacter subterraneus]|uniref:HEPN domain-containing protein n=1 Tax=Dyadobacter subterraneus TaxID=2773304 RepID=A0ABR9WAG5_9BACT|nr:hypothetical protein [Dyadobacter subterraneus]MBE9461956.1 hypothetical protein [Dyadobacter subterraneus]
METSYEIIISLRAVTGWLTFGYFQSGYHKEQAVSTFESLVGRPDEQVSTLRMELFEHGPSGSLPLANKSCNLEELSENVRIITRDAFKYVNLE